MPVVRRNYPKLNKNNVLICKKCGNKMLESFQESRTPGINRTPTFICIGCGEYFFKDQLKRKGVINV